MSNSDKEFEKCMSGLFRSIVPNANWKSITRLDLFRILFDNLYPYKERCEKLEKFKELYGLASQDRDNLEALLIEACEVMADDEHNKRCKCLTCEFKNKPEIKKLLEGGK